MIVAQSNPKEEEDENDVEETSFPTVEYDTTKENRIK